jgi:hypothetical protein
MICISFYSVFSFGQPKSRKCTNFSAIKQFPAEKIFFLKKKSSFSQIDGLEKGWRNGTEFKSIFTKMVSGNYEGTVSGAICLRKNASDANSVYFYFSSSKDF